MLKIPVRTGTIVYVQIQYVSGWPGDRVMGGGVFGALSSSLCGFVVSHVQRIHVVVCSDGYYLVLSRASVLP